MQYELTQRFFFEAAHTLERKVDAEPSRRIHGHTYFAEVAVRGAPQADTGMVMDLGHLRRAIDPVRDALDHRLLDEVEGLTRPTLEGLCSYIASALSDSVPQLAWVRVWREASGDTCTLTLRAPA
ncbi:6-pyruvoyl trahydropterin synthase family protein [Caldimonas brevitalea]|uniref:6-carboxy-5,6,7,8-tetrahydropterin synthase n=1 Tax=Caldimonas brevitalea TaxID=413882 RepID=A0A0G3BFI8_9BURK|nr:6-carboxytetrahydropterin synthase [Caldimonas brevitalea]AKJ26733.1 6-pyruvoyl tetrahydrobiopterin synthase [Caldimonas brevitalea]